MATFPWEILLLVSLGFVVALFTFAVWEMKGRIEHVTSYLNQINSNIQFMRDYFIKDMVKNASKALTREEDCR
jgi:hypothetical protein